MNEMERAVRVLDALDTDLMVKMIEAARLEDHHSAAHATWMHAMVLVMQDELGSDASSVDTLMELITDRIQR